MKPFSMRNTLVVTAAAAGIMIAIPARAVDHQVITASITSVGALSVLNTANMDFGTWLITGVGSGEEVVFVKPSSTGAVVATPTAGATATQIRAVTAPAELTVQIPGGTSAENGLVVQMQRSAITQFAGGHATLSAVQYQTATETTPTTMATTTNVPVTITDGTAAEPVHFGATVTVTDVLPNGANTATFDVTFSY